MKLYYVIPAKAGIHDLAGAMLKVLGRLCGKMDPRLRGDDDGDLRECNASSRAAAFSRREDGAVMVEAAFVIPILVMLFLGMVEFSEAFTVRRRVVTVTSTMADLIAQADKLSLTDLADLSSVAKTLLAPYNTDTATITVRSVGRDENNNITVLWNCTWTKPGTSPGCGAGGDAYPLPDGLINQGESVIVADVSYVYTPVVGQFLLSGVTFHPVAYFKPRVVKFVTLD